MHPRFLSPLLAVLLTLPLTVAASATPDRSDLDARFDARRSTIERTGAQAVVADPDGSERSGQLSRPSALLREAVLAREGLPAARATRTFVAERWDVPALMSDDEPSDEDDPDQDWDWQPGTTAYATGAGDLTGDGADDLLVAEETVEAGADGQPLVRIDLEARRGASGALLWRAEDIGFDAFAWPAGDLTGDGITDVLSLVYEVTSLSFGDDCDDSGCRFSFAGDYERALRLRSGATGELVWEDVGAASERYEERWDDDGYDFRYELEGLLLPILLDDRDGDGGRDLAETLVESFAVQARAEWTDLQVAAVEEWQATQRATTRDAVRSGSTGTAQRFAEVVDSPEIGLLTAAGDLTGDTTADLARQRFAMTDWDARCVWVILLAYACDNGISVTTAVDAVDGDSLEVLWSASYDGYGDVWPLAADATGDGSDDVTVTVEDDDAVWQILLAGRTGDEIWRRETADPWDLLVPVGDLTGRGATDLVNLSFELDDDPVAGQYQVVLTRVDGASGAELFTTRWSAPADANLLLLWAGVTGDLDGDAVADLNAGYVAYEFGEDDDWEFVGSEDVLESGRDGTVGLQVSDDPDRFLWAVRDLGGDGLRDVYDVRFGEDGSSASVTASQLAAWQAEPLWTLDGEGWWALPWPAGELDGSLGADPVDIREVDRDGRVGYRLSVLNGRTLAPVWTVEG